MNNKFYETLCLIYKNLFSIIENFFLRDKKNNKSYELFNYKFFDDVKFRIITYDNFEKIKINKYLNKIIFPRDDIKNLIIDIFHKEKIAEKITEITGFNYKIDFFTAYETYQIQQNDLDKGWYANHYHQDKPYSSNMMKLIFSFKDITKDDGPMEIKFFDKVDNKEKKLPWFTGDSKKTFVSTSGDRTSGRVNFLTGKGERKKFLGVVVKWI